MHFSWQHVVNKGTLEIEMCSLHLFQTPAQSSALNTQISMGSRSDLVGVDSGQNQIKAFTEGFIPNMYRDPDSYPRNATKVLKAICDCLGFGKPTYILEKGPVGPEIEKVHQVTCDIDGLMCSAMATSTEE
ncbi:unnamed protein product, partial [Allacma fusca]